MPKSITFIDLPSPSNLISSVVSGGTLATGSTYYYVIQACFDAGTSVLTTNGRSLSSNEISSSITTSGSQSVSLSWTASLGAGGYRLYRATSPGAYLEMLNIAVRTSVHCTGGICTVVDNGIGTPGNTAYQNVCRGKLELSGSISTDPFSIVDLYNSSSALGWGVVDSLDESTYIVKSHIVGHNNMYWTDVDKTIVFRDSINGGNNSVYTFGEKVFNGTTRRGCRLIFKVPDLYTTNMNTLFAYKTTFDYVGTFNPYRVYTNLSPFNISWNSGSVEYCLINKLRGFPPGSKTSCSLSNSTITEADIALGTGLAQFSNVTGMSNGRIFQTTNGTQITGSNITSINDTYTTYLLGIGFSVKYINSISASLKDAFLSTSSGSAQDVFTYDLKVVNTSGIPISGANVTLLNSSGSTMFNTTTNTSGSITQQEVLLYIRHISGGLGPVTTFSPYTLQISQNGYENYREISTVSSSIALNKIVALKETGSTNTNIYNGTFYNSVIY